LIINFILKIKKIRKDDTMNLYYNNAKLFFFSSLIILSFLLSFNTFSNNPILKNNDTPSLFSPYNDVTVGAVWNDWQHYPEGRPADLAPISQQTGTKGYVLAFIQSINGECKAGWAGISAMSVDSKWGKYLTDQLTTNKINYAVSFGGASGVDLSAACTAIADLENIYEQVFSTFQPNTLDFDIEGSFQEDVVSITRMMDALKILQQNHPGIKITLTLPTMPEGLTSLGENIVTIAKNADLNFTVNVMAMDYGSSYDQDMGQYAIQASENLFLFLKTLYPTKSEQSLWNMVEVTPMIGLNDVSTEVFTTADADAVNEFSKEKGMGGVHMWSVARDNPCSDQWASPTCSGINNQTKYEFMEHFAK
jgi:chitinase